MLLRSSDREVGEETRTQSIGRIWACGGMTAEMTALDLAAEALGMASDAMRFDTSAEVPGAASTTAMEVATASQTQEWGSHAAPSEEWLARASNQGRQGRRRRRSVRRCTARRMGRLAWQRM